MQLYIDTF